MSSIGETLRRERLRRNLDIDQISRELKISHKLLEAIEAEEFDKLPGTIFAKNFVRQYAHLLGLDEDEMAAEVQRALQPPSFAPQFVEAGKAAPEPIPVAPISLPKVQDWESAADHRFSWSSPLPALALLVIVMLICSGVYTWYQRKSHPVLAQNTVAVAKPAEPPPAAQASVEQPQPQAPGAAQPVPPPENQAQSIPPQTPAAQSATPQSAPVQAPAGVAAKPATPAVPPDSGAPAGPVTIRLQITAQEPSWVLVRTDGKYLFSGTMEPNQSRTVEASRNVELRLGNAGGVSVTMNGNAIGAIGPKGQVRTVQFTSGGFQIVAAPKSAPLLDPL